MAMKEKKQKPQKSEKITITIDDLKIKFNGDEKFYFFVNPLWKPPQK
jgi:hypothetical protein